MLFPAFRTPRARLCWPSSNSNIEDNRYFLGTPSWKPAFIIQHFAGKVKYQIKVRSHLSPLSIKLRSAQGWEWDPWVPWRSFPSGACSVPLFIAFAWQGSRALRPSVKPWPCFREAPRQEPLSVVEMGPTPHPAFPGADPRASANTSKGPPATLLTHRPHARTSERRTWTT